VKNEPLNFAHEVSLSYSKDSLTCRKILRHVTDGFTSPLKEVVLRGFIALTNLSSLAGFEPVNLESMASRLTTEPPRATLLVFYIEFN
jgi:hypothetical protein